MSEYPHSPLFAFARLSAFVLALFFVSAPAAQSQTDTSSWVGRKVYLKPNAKAMDGAKIVTTSQMAWDEVVLKEQGPWVYLRDAWVAKSDVMNLNEAFDYWVDEVRRNPQSATAWNGRGRCWRERGEYNNALKDFDEAIRLNPKDYAAYGHRGRTKLEVKDYYGAINDLNESIRLNPRGDDLYTIRGSVRFATRDHEGALKDFNEAIRLDPSNATAYSNRGATKSRLKDYEGAIKDYTEAIRLHPLEHTHYGLRGIAKQLNADYEGALKDYNEAIRLAPQDSFNYSLRAQLLSTANDASIRNGTSALSDAKKAAELTNFKTRSPLSALACAHAELGDFNAAVEWQQKANALLDENTNEDVRNRYQKRLEAFQRNEPYRE